MKLPIVLLALLGFVAAASIPNKNVKIARKDLLGMQKFLLEIVYRVEDPLMFEELIKRGDKLIVDKSLYTQFDLQMEKFYKASTVGALLPKGEFFGALVISHAKQAWGLFNFFYYAKDWETFMQNVCWARLHINEGMFVYALNLAVIHRDDFDGLILPAIHEIFPQFFFNSKFVFEAEKFDYDVWSKTIMYEKEFHDVYCKDLKDLHDHPHFYTQDWKTWQWWKMMGIGEHWFLENRFLLRENIGSFNRDSMWLDILRSSKVFYMPVDYTRDIDIFNDHSKLSYITEDLGWNSYWYYLNLDYAFFSDGKTKKDRRGENWVYNIQQLLARYYMERLSHGFGDIPELLMRSEDEHGYDCHLVSYNGVSFSTRNNYWEFKSNDKDGMLNNTRSFTSRLYAIIDLGYYEMADGTIVDLRKPDYIEIIGSMLQSNVDILDKYFFNYWYLLMHMYVADVDYNDTVVVPHVFLNYETMLRYPTFYILYKKISDVFFRFKDHLKPYTHEELLYPGVTIKDVHVEDLVTFFDLVDFDVTNLLNDKMTFVDGKLVWDKTLLARQMRLNHKPIQFKFQIESDKPQKVVIRTFLGPKFDEFGRFIPLRENRENFMELDEFTYSLVAGKNIIKRTSLEFDWTSHDRMTYTELYKLVMLAYESKHDLPLYYSKPNCGFPNRLVLPHGWVKGMPMQMFFIVIPFTADFEQLSTYDYNYSCGIGSGTRHIDNIPFGYPFDRIIDEYEFVEPNTFFKDVKIFHEDKFQKYWEKKYEHFGTFDYDIFGYRDSRVSY